MTAAPVPMQGTQTTLRVPRKALLIGRERSDAGGLVRLVEEEGYFVWTVANADDALDRLRADRFELVLLDVGVPGMGAVRFVEALRRDPHLSGMPVLVISDAGDVDDVDAVERCLTGGADDCLPARFGPAMLRARVNAALDRRGLLDNQHLRRDMDVARKIQRDFLPESLPVVPGVTLAAMLDAARQVSGDFYDAFQLPSGRIVLVLGDVCDKGVGAALFMALFRSLIRASADPVGGGAIQMIGGRHTLVMQAVERASPADLLTRVAQFTNNYIAVLHGRTNMFATVFLAVLDPLDGSLDYVNAGHEPALIVGRSGIRELRPTGPALGIIPDADFRAAEAKLEIGESFLAFTDGVVEARSPTDESFGGERLRELVRGLGPTSAPDLVRELWGAVKAFEGQAEPHDDLTVLAATRE
ncbi:MAG TPA: SpoIIE family protein phosphatase [Gemmatimonadaceae bacterium]|nr:SpoIIE family protein phosphatase [Gemmatimonadaceae bacterium]